MNRVGGVIMGIEQFLTLLMGFLLLFLTYIIQKLLTNVAIYKEIIDMILVVKPDICNDIEKYINKEKINLYERKKYVYYKTL